MEVFTESITLILKPGMLPLLRTLPLYRYQDLQSYPQKYFHQQTPILHSERINYFKTLKHIKYSRSTKVATISRDHQTSRINLAVKENYILPYLCLKSIYKNAKTQERVMGTEKEAIICCH